MQGRAGLLNLEEWAVSSCDAQDISFVMYIIPQVTIPRANRGRHIMGEAPSLGLTGAIKKISKNTKFQIDHSFISSSEYSRKVLMTSFHSGTMMQAEYFLHCVTIWQISQLGSCQRGNLENAQVSPISGEGHISARASSYNASA